MDTTGKDLAPVLNTPIPEVNEESVPAIASELKRELGGTYKERLEEEKTLYVKISGTTKPEVTLTGFWNGRLIHIAMNAISKAYRTRVHKPTKRS